MFKIVLRLLICLFFNARMGSGMKKTNILCWLDESAEKYGDRIAVVDENGSLDFSSLKEKAERIGTLIAEKLSSRKPVVLYLEKSVNAWAAMLGCVEAGCFYSVLDPSLPKGRLQDIFGTLEAELVLSDRDDAGEIFPDCEVVSLESASAFAIDIELLKRRRNTAKDTDPLYVNFTSGSTGKPKGVAVCQRSVLDFIPVFTETFGIEASDVLGNQAPFDFDVSVKDLYSSLYTGACAVLIPRKYFSQPVALMDYLCDHEVTVLVWAVSALCFVSIMNGLKYRVPTQVRMIMFSGERMPVKHLNRWREYLPQAEYVNLYGPTEITCNCTYHVLNEEYEEGDVMPIGVPFDNESVFLLDEDNCEVTSSNVKGEICVTGTCLALGYYRDQEKTESVFVQNPLNTCWAERMYRTGDLGYYDEKGLLVYAGRKDFQIKHMGRRIELGEIESVSGSVEGVERSCCLYDDVKKKIVMVYEGSAEKDFILNEMRSYLPAWMIPSKVVQVERIPLTDNGKMDRKKLKEAAGIV